MSFQDIKQAISTCRVIDGTYIDLLVEHINGSKKQWDIGPLNPVTFSKHIHLDSQEKLLEWLNKQASKSVLYLSFGISLNVR